MNDPAEIPQADGNDTPAKITTPELEKMLRQKHPRERYALFFDVPDTVSINAKRRIDAVACGMWASEGQHIQGFELKVSRSDWLRELKSVNKADPFIAICDYFWLVTGDAKIAKLEEIPACWGWMSATKTGLRVQRPATKLPGVGRDVPRGFMLGVLRKMQDDLLRNPDVQAFIEEQVRRATGHFDDRVRSETAQLKHRLERAEKQIKDFEETSGINLAEWRYGRIGEIVKSLKDLGFGGDAGLNRVPELLERQENELTYALNAVKECRSRISEVKQ